MKISLVIPPSAFLINDRAFPFLGPLQIGAVARNEGHEIRVHDLTGYKLRNPSIEHANPELVYSDAFDVLFRELDPKTEVIGFYSLAAQHPFVVRLHNKVKEAFPHMITIIGGPHASTAPNRCKEDGFDYVVISDQGGGGGEAGFIKIINAIKNGDKIIDIVREPSRKGVKWEGDEWPLPARDLIDLNSYSYYLGTEKATSIVTATGCPFACTYCSHWEGYRKQECKSSGRVREEIREINKNYKLNAYMFYDDEINLRPDFSDEFLPMLGGENIIWRGFFKNGKNLTKESVFEQMAGAGCYEICSGIESADPKILKDIKKGATVEDNTNFVKYCIKYKIRAKCFLQVGLPGETHDTLKALHKWVIDMANIGLTDADFSITVPYEGTPIYDNPEKHNIHFNKEEMDFSKKVVLYKGVPGEYKSYVHHNTLSAKDLVDARDWLEKEFRSAAGLKPLLAAGKDDG